MLVGSQGHTCTQNEGLELKAGVHKMKKMIMKFSLHASCSYPKSRYPGGLPQMGVAGGGALDPLLVAMTTAMTLLCYNFADPSSIQ